MKYRELCGRDIYKRGDIAFVGPWFVLVMKNSRCVFKRNRIVIYKGPAHEEGYTIVQENSFRKAKSR